MEGTSPRPILFHQIPGETAISVLLPPVFAEFPATAATDADPFGMGEGKKHIPGGVYIVQHGYET